MRPLHQAHNKDFFLRHLAIKVLPIALLMTASAGFSQSSLLETVKRNPGEAKALCQQFKSLNSEGKSALSSQAIKQLASQRNLSTNDAEILATYVIGLHCSDVR